MSHLKSTMPTFSTTEEVPHSDRKSVNELTAIFNRKEEVSSICFDRSFLQISMDMGVSSTPLQTNTERKLDRFNKMSKFSEKVSDNTRNGEMRTLEILELTEDTDPKYTDIDENKSTNPGFNDSSNESVFRGLEKEKIDSDKTVTSIQQANDNSMKENRSGSQSSMLFDSTENKNSQENESTINDNSNKSERFDESTSGKSNEKFTFGVTSTPIPINIEKERRIFNGIMSSVYGNDEFENEHNGFENLTHVDYETSTESNYVEKDECEGKTGNKNAQLDEHENQSSRMEMSKIAKRVSFHIVPMIKPIQDSRSELADKMGAFRRNFSFSPLRISDSSSPEERENELNALSCLNVTSNTTLWESACSFSDRTEEYEQINHETTVPDCVNQKESGISSEDSPKLNPINTKLRETAVAKDACSSIDPSELESINTKFSESDVREDTDDSNVDGICEISLSSTSSNMSHRVWQTISNSIRSALNSTKEICSFSEKLPKRSFEVSEDVEENLSTEEPSAKRRKYESFVKCRPPIHDMGMIVYVTVNGRSVLLISKSTQTEECYFK